VTWPEGLFAVGCAAIVLVLIGSVNLTLGVAAALLVGLLMWAVFILLPDQDEWYR